MAISCNMQATLLNDLSGQNRLYFSNVLEKANTYYRTFFNVYLSNIIYVKVENLNASNLIKSRCIIGNMLCHTHNIEQPTR